MNIYRVINILFQVYYWLIFIRIILSFIRHNPYQPLIKFIYEVTEPWLSIFRRFIPPVGMIDFSPVLAFFMLEILRQLVITLFRAIGL